ncbi:helix-turn-helix domain-containing protein [Nostoc sp. 'Peltigera membranacea cyanobiont' N6]|uniref:helix-turn-helix domain-containing protein n=1 Tax=Nostoc sp. 'Peltigera membranacea cyanobiont' N6 TaxID=1261031 RepID=UPI000CF313D5|nr:helix-turn-helix transcriptional regulator [Nostoc sp. 'Peltigera membranacea cyanobiont' N6]AVH68483.1 XRE family trascriptional regulator [Nostoc sp. 'Peltigera membranacea cyanobiont' N6]
MTSFSRVTLRIQELLDNKSLSFQDLSNALDISEEEIRKLSSQTIDITEENAFILAKIAKELNVSILDLVQPVATNKAFKFRIFELIEQQGISFEDLSIRTGIHPLILEFYNTNPIPETNLYGLPHSQNLAKISAVLNCTIEDLKLEEKLPKTRILIEELASERGLTLEALSLLIGLPLELLQLLSLHPVNISLADEMIETGRRNNLMLSGMSLNQSIRPDWISSILCCILNRPCCNRK